ncbi:MAG: hypothetical protein R2712_23640 [Vicinamibacterales bacterium]
MTKWMVAALLLAAGTMASARQAGVTLSAAGTIVPPGAAVPVTVTGPPGLFYAVIGSSMGAGATYGGVPWPPDRTWPSSRRACWTGREASPSRSPAPFLFTTLDRYYLQAAVSASPQFVPPTLAAGVVLRNADLVGSLVGAAGPTGPTGPQGAPGAAVGFGGACQSRRSDRRHRGAAGATRPQGNHRARLVWRARSDRPEGRKASRASPV